MIRYWFYGLFVFCFNINLVFAENKINIDTSRGALLYENHCNQCHIKQVHWREKRIVNDWKSLMFQVDRWQKNANLKWDKNDINDVSFYLNTKFYHYP